MYKNKIMEPIKNCLKGKKAVIKRNRGVNLITIFMCGNITSVQLIHANFKKKKGGI
jgi:hypothetical protein